MFIVLVFKCIVQIIKTLQHNLIGLDDASVDRLDQAYD